MEKQDKELRMEPAVDDGDYTTRVDVDQLAVVEKTAEYQLLQDLLQAALTQTPWIRGFKPEAKVAVLLALAAHAAVAGSLSRREILDTFDRFLDRAFQEAVDWNNDVDGIRTKVQQEFAVKAAARHKRQADEVIVVVEPDKELDDLDLEDVRTSLFSDSKKKKLYH